MNEELKKLRQSVQMLQAKIEFQRENSQAISDIVEQMGHGLDAFITIYNDTQQRNEDRLSRSEKHTGLQ